jgi:glycosyltransferase involved in cell wall biosynthesis
MALVSILLPVRDGAATLPAAFDTMLAQSLGDWELVAVDDGSSDATPEWLAAAARRDARVRVVRTPPRGIASALQTGVAICRGSYLARMDADDLMHPDRLARQVACLENRPEVGLVSCRVRYGGEAAGYAEHVDWINAQDTFARMSLRRFVEAPVAHPSVMFRRELLERHGGWRQGDFPEDYELWLRWLEAGVRFAKCPEELLVWNDPPQRLSRRDPRYAVEAFYRIKAGYLARWLRAHVAAERKVWLWGAGRVTRRRFDALEAEGVRFAGFVDVDPSKCGRHRDGRPVRLADDLPDRETSFLLAGVAARGARERIHAHLVARGWREGADFLLVA